MYFEADAA